MDNYQRDEEGVPIPKIDQFSNKPIYETNYFLELASAGKDVWNRWRARHPDVPVSFNGVDFRAIPNPPNFSDFDFGKYANFSGCRFDRKEGWILDKDDGLGPSMAWFAGAAFGDFANFSGAILGHEANFSDTTFGDHCRFSGACFGRETRFLHATFGTGISFTDVTFGNSVNFSSATFKLADFSGAIFSYGPNFSDTKFCGVSYFVGRTEDQWRAAINKVCAAWREEERKRAFLEYCERLHDRGKDLAALYRISFARARFEGAAEFGDRNFVGICDFTDTWFDRPPNFVNCKNTENINLYGAHVRLGGRPPGWTTDSTLAIKLRALRGLADESKNHDLERDLYIEERNAERGIYFWRYRKPKYWHRLAGHLTWIVAMSLYWLCADYGRSFLRPLIGFAASIAIFAWAYAQVLPTPSGADAIPFAHARYAVALANAVPFLGSLTVEKDVKAFLFCAGQPRLPSVDELGPPNCLPTPPGWFQELAFVQSIVSILFFFFIALALRNYFKIK
jgi:uncharacterized protein YjbI with pentapeptide repeats